MVNDKKNRDEYPKQSENDKRWKQQDEFDSAGAQRQLEDEDKNNSLPKTGSDTSSDKDRSKDEA